MAFKGIGTSLSIFTLLFSLGVADEGKEAQESKQKPVKNKYRFFLKLGSGASFADKASVYAPPSQWDPAVQGYDSGLGTRPIILGGLGYEFCDPFSTDITFSYRPHYKYRKYQTPVGDIGTPGSLGPKTREFNLDVASVMFTFYLSSRGWSPLCWKLGSDTSLLYPLIGGGVGISQMTIYDFRSTGIAPVDAAIDPTLSFASDNQYTKRFEFTYQLMGGLEYRWKDRWALSAGYRWFDVAQFKGPSFIRDQYGNAYDLRGEEWEIRFRANEIFLEFKVLF